MAAPISGFDRFAFVAEALDATGGFRPTVICAQDEQGLAKPSAVVGSCYLIPYPRESMSKFAARAAVSVYENHLRSACERFVGYLVRKPPHREGADGPLSSKFLEDADWAGNALDVFWASFMVEARARGTMLALLDMPAAVPPTLAQQTEARALPYITAIKPEHVRRYELGPQGRFNSVAIDSTEVVDGKDTPVIREWTTTGWRILLGERVLRDGTHNFGACPVLAFTERDRFPCFGQFEQIAHLSRRVFNAQSELDEILRSQTFSLLTYQVPTDAAATFDASKVAAVIGTHNLLTHSGDTPAFIAPGDGPAKVYMERIAGLEASIRRIGLEVEDSAAQSAESGTAKAIRFQALNSALSSFATRMQDFERQVWDLFARATSTENRVTCTWSDDYSLADSTDELDKLTLMQAAGFSDLALIEKRKQIAAAEFANLEPSDLEVILDSLDTPATEVTPPGDGTDPSADPNADPANPPNGDPNHAAP